MSPSEKDLRAALRHGEGEPLSADRIILRGQQTRARRRTQLLSGIGVAVLIAGVGAGAWALGGGGSSESAGGSQQQDTRAAAPAAGASTPAESGCPSSLPRYVLPPSGSSSTAPLFSGAVSTVVVCDYGPTAQALGTNPPPARKSVVHGADAAALVDSLDQTSASKPTGMCPQYRLATERQVAIRGLSADGQSVGLVTTVLGRPSCATDVRNGKTVRYGWTPPEWLVKDVPGGGYSHGPVLQSVPPS